MSDTKEVVDKRVLGGSATKNIEERDNRELRIKRRKLHRSGPLKFKEIPGFKTRIVRDRPGRIDRLLELGYEFVHDHEVYEGDIGMADRDIDKNASIVKKMGADGIMLYLLKIPEDLYEDYQTDKDAELKEILREDEPDPSMGFIRVDKEIK